MTTTEVTIPITPRRRAARTPRPRATAAPVMVLPADTEPASARQTGAGVAVAPNPLPPAGTPPEASPSKRRARPTVKPAKVARGSLGAVGAAWIEAIREAGHSDSTVSSYRRDLEVAYTHLGADTAVDSLTEKLIAAFNACKAVMKKRNGKAKAKATVLKTRRALRLALTWAEQEGLIKKAPYAAD